MTCIQTQAHSNANDHYSGNYCDNVKESSIGRKSILGIKKLDPFVNIDTSIYDCSNEF